MENALVILFADDILIFRNNAGELKNILKELAEASIKHFTKNKFGND